MGISLNRYAHTYRRVKWMANSERRYIDKTGKMFIPMNVEGGGAEDNFITTPKLVLIALMVGSGIIIGLSLADAYAPLKAYLIYYSIWLFICSLVTRFFILEEKYYYRMYQQLKSSEISTPAIFWDIASIKDTLDGAILTYSDAKVGVLVRLDRDTITGKPQDFKETHYDAISDFYKEIMLRKYSFVQMNVMEQAGNDPRLEELDKLVYKNTNKNIQELMERQIGHIKNITHSTLYESDYILIYTTDMSRIDRIVDDAVDIIYKIMDGAYIGYRVLRARDIIEFMKEEYGVKYFNYTEATLAMFKSKGINAKSPFDLVKIVYSDGDIQELRAVDINKINKLTNDIMNGLVDLTNLSIKDTLYPKHKQNINGVEFESLSEGFRKDEPVVIEKAKIAKPKGRVVAPLPKLNRNKQEKSDMIEVDDFEYTGVEGSDEDSIDGF